MFKNYLKIVFRKLLKNKTSSFITVSGMAIGIACCLMIATYISYELNYDNFHPHADRTYRVIFGGNHDGSELLASYLAANFPEVEQVVRIEPGSRSLKLFGRNNAYFYEDNFYKADPSFFEIFGFSLEQGDPHTALGNPNSIVISRKIA